MAFESKVWMFCIGLVHAILIGTIRQHTSFPFLDELWVRAYPYIGKHFILFDVLVVLVFTSMAIAPFVWCVKNELGFSDIFVFLIPVSIVHAFMVATEWPNFDMVLISVFGSIVIGLLIKYPIVRLPKKNSNFRRKFNWLDGKNISCFIACFFSNIYLYTVRSLD